MLCQVGRRKAEGGRRTAAERRNLRMASSAGLLRLCLRHRFGWAASCVPGVRKGGISETPLRLGCFGCARRSELGNHCSAGLLRLCPEVRTWKSLFGWGASAVPGGPKLQIFVRLCSFGCARRFELEVTVRLGCFGCAIEITGRLAALLRTSLPAASLAPQGMQI